ncbi:hypothetical protein PF010_g21857 [Phytophthora fragariae]|uniref:Uncharacterized protein n=1 Tax=Phytophthora fragariae TaxID=53985 RepID=A0A6A3R803_9STRA|nr:hypothetical protein PF003_g25212 [Phytophthora fragariae]KAE8930540.1 hypothetical protein PF009_g19373 [Phytophthora fragariae]KAE9081775.1 hypothetical protein PF010_g21857 [Phytophthora fragariae]KAE9091984.1 hypothetical protein PF007_g18695 [Phytophthora fragariae]KAE9105673.1 hypothetical protein PF006_g21564 [Phytophthora fragariae]
MGQLAASWKTTPCGWVGATIFCFALPPPSRTLSNCSADQRKQSTETTDKCCFGGAN